MSLDNDRAHDIWELDRITWARQQLNQMAWENVRKIYREKLRKDCLAAANFIRENRDLSVDDLHLTCDEDELKKWCQKRVTECGAYLSNQVEYVTDLPNKLRWCLKILDRYGIEPPVIYSTVEGRVSADLMPLARRFIDVRWWLRNARKLQVRVVDQYYRAKCRVARGRQVYVSDWALKNRWAAEKRNRFNLEGAVATNDLGQEFTLAELADLGQANLTNRRNELMTRIRGFEEVAQLMGHVGDFWTLTAASKFHRMTYIEKAKRAVKVEKWNGADPRKVHQHLVNAWAKIRAELAREGIRCYGFRVVEPHHDGTPHWHLMLFFHPDEVMTARAIAKRYALAVDGTEQGAQEHRFTAKAIDPAKGTASGYIAKYIAKNIDGFCPNLLDDIDDDSGLTMYAGAQRVRAWASVWGIRQFQQIGGASVTVWRELRRVWSQSEPGTQTDLFGSSTAEAAGEAADRGDWAAYTMAMGGVFLPRADRPLKPAYWVDVDYKVDAATGELLNPEAGLTEYGDPKTGQIFGVAIENAGYLLSRICKWTVNWFGKAKQAASRVTLDGWRVSRSGFAFDVGRGHATLGLV